MPIEYPKRYRDLDDTKHSYPQKNLARHVIKGDPMPTPSQLEQAVAGWNKGDPLADDWIAEANRLPPGEGRKLLEQALNHGIDSVNNPPATLVALFKQLDRTPIWLDQGLLQAGAHSYQRNPRLGLDVLRHVSLMGGYVAGSVIKPLTMTGRLTYKADRRLAETTQFTIDVTLPGALSRYGEGFKSAVRVRVMHAMVRQMIWQNRDTNGWDAKQYAMPINQTDMLGTNLLFSFNYLVGCRALGAHFTHQESLGVMHVWRYVGLLMGIDECRLPSNESEAARLLYLINGIQDEPNEDSRALATALHEVPKHLAQTPLQKATIPLRMHYGAGMTRLFMGNQLTDELGLPGRKTRYAVVAMALPRFVFERIRCRSKQLTRWSNRYGQRYRQHYTESLLKGHRAEFQPVDKLQKINS